MKKINKKGFTLIELLAVIVIMGILMLVAIPAVSRTIENSRKETFANTATSYINAVINAVSADELECSSSASDGAMNTRISSSLGSTSGTKYFVNISSDSTININQSYNNQQALMEQGGKSSWGNADVKGHIEISKIVKDGQTKYTYKMALIDSGNHGTYDSGFKAVGNNNKVKKSDIRANAGSYSTQGFQAYVKGGHAAGDADGKYPCQVVN